MPTILPENIQYHALPIPEDEKEWIRSIYSSLSDEAVIPGIVEIALELAWKRGYAKGAR